MRQTKLLMAVAAALTFACTDIDEPPRRDTDTAQTATAKADDEETPTVEGCTVLGDRIEIPYTTNNMRRAMTALRAGNKAAVAGGMTEDDIATTHLYLRFAPRDSADVMALERHTAIMFSDVPMDREIAAAGDYYHDPSLPDSVPTYQYCAVRVGQPLPDVPHETLAELFLMEETNVYDDAETASGNKAADPLWETLEAEAYAQVGLSDYLEDDGGEPAAGNKGAWRPGGRLRYEDTTSKKDVPMEGVPIRYRRILVVHQCCTDAEGYFNFGRMRGKVSYYAKWQRDDFHIRGIGKAVTVAKTWLSGRGRRRVDFVIRPDRSEAWKYASVFRAAHYYYYKHAELGLSRPGDRNLVIRLSYKTPSKDGVFISPQFPGTSNIKVYYHKLSNSYEFFGITIHEIAHSAHFNWDKIRYWQTSTKVKEAWARGVENRATMKVYNMINNNYNGTYTGIVMGLMDIDTNVGNGDISKQKETVSGFTISEIEASLRGATTWTRWRDNLKHKTYNGRRQQEQIDKLFEAWDF